MPYYPQSYGYAPQPYPQQPVRVKPPVARGQIPAYAPAKLKLPSPEELGIRLGKREAALDWDQLRQQLDRLGANGFQLEKHGDGFRFACLLPTGSVEGLGSTEAAAVEAALVRLKK